MDIVPIFWRYIIQLLQFSGNNMYDTEMVEELNRVTDPVERSQYILMERVNAPVVKNYIVHINFEKPKIAETVTELGIFGVFIRYVSGIFQVYFNMQY